MTSKIKAETILRTQRSADTGRVEVTFADTQGERQTLSLNPEIATALASALKDFGCTVSTSGPAATKMPKRFAVGSGRYEPVVLVRFEDEVPYGLDASQATALGLALVEEAESISEEGEALRQ